MDSTSPIVSYLRELNNVPRRVAIRNYIAHELWAIFCLYILALRKLSVNPISAVLNYALETSVYLVSIGEFKQTGYKGHGYTNFKLYFGNKSISFLAADIYVSLFCGQAQAK